MWILVAYLLSRNNGLASAIKDALLVLAATLRCVCVRTYAHLRSGQRLFFAPQLASIATLNGAASKAAV
jgi:hypothetical protein